MRKEVLKTAAGGAGQIVVFHIDRAEEAEWRREEYEQARQRLGPATLDPKLVGDIRRELESAR